MAENNKTNQQSSGQSWYRYGWYNNDIEVIKPAKEALSIPRFAIRHIQAIRKDLSYRKINDWEHRRLIRSWRNTDIKGWRKFSIVEAVELIIIADLKAFGVHSERIEDILNQLLIREDDSSDSPLFFLIDASMAGGQIGLSIPIIGSIQIIYQTAPTNQIDNLGSSKSSFIYLPLSEYVRQLLKSINIEVMEKPANLEITIRERERKLLEIIHNHDFEKIEIVKSNGNTLNISAIRRKRGDFSERDVMLLIRSGDYQKVELSQKGGKILSLIQEEKFKL
jgi:hypothetical protein